LIEILHPELDTASSESSEAYIAHPKTLVTPTPTKLISVNKSRVEERESPPSSALAARILSKKP
jgi:hypothetical protein